MIAAYRAAMDKGLHTNTTILSNYKPRSRRLDALQRHQWTEPCDTRVPMETLKAVAKAVTTVPDGFKVHPRVERVLADRRAMGEGKLPLDWGMAETLAYGTLLNQGIGVRLSGEDTARGTFSHRHAVLHDQNREKWDAGSWTPLEHVRPEQPEFEVIDSVLTEYGLSASIRVLDVRSAAARALGSAVRGFRQRRAGRDRPVHRVGRSEMGTDLQSRDALPHGYEGQGPEHSSARPERYLQLCAEHNMQVCVPSTRRRSFISSGGRCCARSGAR